MERLPKWETVFTAIGGSSAHCGVGHAEGEAHRAAFFGGRPKPARFAENYFRDDQATAK
jgi:hypothetical protein